MPTSDQNVDILTFEIMKGDVNSSCCLETNHGISKCIAGISFCLKHSHTPVSEIKVHPAPGEHIFTAGCTILGGVHRVCARFLSHLLLLYIGRVHGPGSWFTVLWQVHLASAQNKSLILDTGTISSTTADVRLENNFSLVDFKNV